MRFAKAVFGTIGLIVMVQLVIGCAPATLSQPPAEVEKDSTESLENIPAGESSAVPFDYVGFQFYKKSITGNMGAPTQAIIEATVLAVSSQEVCPFQEEVCSVPPYPLDTGRVRIDTVVSLTGSDASQSVDEQADDAAEGDSSVRSSAGSQGQDIVVQSNDQAAIAVGQERNAIFILTASPVTVQSLGTSDGPSTSPDDLVREDSGVGQSNSSAERFYYELPRKNGRIVFTIGHNPNGKTTQTHLPGLKPGDKIRATVNISGDVYIEEYAIINH